MNNDFFINPIHPIQKRYEALRAYHHDRTPAKEVAARFGYTLYTFYSLIRDFKQSGADDFFKPSFKGPHGHHKKIKSLKEGIITLRKKNYSIAEIQEVVDPNGNDISYSNKIGLDFI